VKKLMTTAAFITGGMMGMAAGTVIACSSKRMIQKGKRSIKRYVNRML